MNHDLNISVMQKLIALYPEAEDFISERADEIAAKRLKSSERAAFNRGVEKVFSPLTINFWKQAFEGAAQILGGNNKSPYSYKSESGFGHSFDWACENFRLAACDFIHNKNVPMDIFTPDEQIFIKGESTLSAQQSPAL